MAPALTERQILPSPRFSKLQSKQGVLGGGGVFCFSFCVLTWLMQGTALCAAALVAGWAFQEPQGRRRFGFLSGCEAKKFFFFLFLAQTKELYNSQNKFAVSANQLLY